MKYEEYLLLRDPYEISEAVRKALEPRTVQFGSTKINIVSNPGMPSDIALMWCGPNPENQVWLTGLADQADDRHD